MGEIFNKIEKVRSGEDEKVIIDELTEAFVGSKSSSSQRPTVMPTYLSVKKKLTTPPHADKSRARQQLR